MIKSYGRLGHLAQLRSLPQVLSEKIIPQNNWNEKNDNMMGI